MSKKAETELAHLKMALSYLIGLLEEGSLVPRYHEATRREIGEVLGHLMVKVAGLPEGVPDNLVQATAVRAIVEAADRHNLAEREKRAEDLARHMRQAEAGASIRGHILGAWEQVTGSDMEYQATCTRCGGFVYVSHTNIYNLLLDSCERL